MNTKNLETLKIHKLTQAQYDRELAAGNIDENALYLTPDDNVLSTNMMVVTGTVADATPVFEDVTREDLTTDKTYEEVLEHVNNGGYVVFYLKDTRSFYVLDMYTGDIATRNIASDVFIFKNTHTFTDAIYNFNIYMLSTGEVYRILETTPLTETPDWSVNDENDLAFIKNRPFYTTDPVETTVVEETTVEIGDDLYALISSNLTFVEGQTYKVTFNGTEYECVASAVFYGGYYIGNISIAGGNGGNGEPFCCVSINSTSVIYVSETGTYTIKITTIQTEDIQLPEKYISYKPGLNVEGKVYTIDNEEVTAEKGAEIFNDYVNNIASGFYSHAEGISTTATDTASHAEGQITTASGTGSHAEGSSTTASGNSSHAEGASTTASGFAAHAEGSSTIAAGHEQHVQGKYNIEDTENKYAHIVGNGDRDVRSNAHTLDWDGTAEYQGDVIAYGCESGEEPISLKAVSEKVNDISWNTLEDKPFGETYVEITPETSFVIESQLVSTDNALIGELEVGKTYEITWDGVVYNCECKVITQTDPDLGLTMAQKYLGNLKYSEIEGYEEDTGEPFFIIYESTSDKYYAVKTGSRRGTHTIAIKGLFETSTVNMASGDSMRGPGVGASFTVGETYKVTWDGVVYNCECKYYEYNQYNKYHYVGNLSLRFDNQEDTGEPFLMYYYTNIGNNPHVTSLSGEHTVEIENLVPERTIKINSSSIETLSIPLPFTFNTELVEGQNYKVVLNDKTYICECKTIMGEIPYIGNLSLVKDIILGTGEPFLIIIEPNMGPMYLYDLPGEFTIIVYGEGVKQLDPKFLPEHSWNTLEDKPFGTFRGVIAEGHDVPAMMIGMVSEFPMLSFDKTYTFNFNGVDYQGVLKILPDMTPVEGSTMGCYIGNITLLTGTMGGMADSLLGDAADDIVDTGEPFFIMDMGDNMAIACWAANELNMTISDGENIVVENVSVTAMMEGAACIIPVNYPISEGGLYEITIDDMNVIGECKNRNGTLYVGNVFLSTGKEEENTGESFYFEYSDETEPTTGIRVRILRGIFPEGKIISIVKFIGDYNKQIDSKYLDLDLSSKPGELGTGIYSEIFNDYTGNIASGEYSHAEGSGTDALGDYSHAEGIGSIASGEYSHAEGYYTEATGSRSHAEGSMTLASGHMGAHAEGHSTVASGRCSHSEGQATLASEEYAHAEGTWTVAAGIASHAEGVGYDGNSSRYIKISAEANSTTLTINDDLDASYKHLLIHSEIGNSNITDCKVVDGKVVEITVDNPLSTKTLTNSSEQLSLKNIATGEASHVEGKRTLALSDYQHVQGKYNALDTDDKYAHIVGNGTNDDNRSNAHTLDWEGNAEYQGDVIAYGCGGESPISLKALLDRIVSLETELAELKASALTTITDDGEGNVTIE